MTRGQSPAFDPRLDLEFERVVDVRPALLWKGWTTPDLITQWFTPAPWKTVACQIDLRPGGAFSSTMQSPDGQQFSNTGSYLQVVENELLVWTNALLAGFRPAPKPAVEVAFVFTALVSFTPEGSGTRYYARAMHRDESDRARHESMRFEEGWGKALDQLVALVRHR